MNYALLNPYELGSDFSTKKRIDGWDPDSTNCKNPHLLITGQSGAGKSTLLKALIDYLGNKKNKIVFVLDIHNGLEVENENYIQYTARDTKVGINPFEFDFDTTNGGPEIRADVLVQLFKKHFMPNAGPVQQNVLRDLFVDAYKYNGIYDNNVKTWPMSEIDDYSHDTSSNTTLPTMTDLEDVYQMILNMVSSKGGISYKTHIQMELEYYKTKIQEAKSPSIKDNYEKKLSQRQDEVGEYNKFEEDEDIEDLVWFSKHSIDYKKYTNRNVVSTLNTIGVYLRTFASMNIFNAKKPKFNRNINRLDLSGFTNAGKPEFALFFFDLFLQRVFGKCKLKGEYKDRPAEQRNRGNKCDVFVVIDESRVVLPTGRDKDNPYHMLNRITAESRKYGLGLILGTQRITHYSDDILANIYTKILLQTDPSDIPISNKKLKIQNKDLLTLTKYNDVGVVGMGGIYRAVHFDLFEQYKMT